MDNRDNPGYHYINSIVSLKNWLYKEPRFRLAKRVVSQPPQITLSETDSSPLGQLETAVSQCEKCSISSARTQTVFGSGNPHSSLMVIGEAPGFEEDKLGYPFVGKAGQLLDKMLAAIDINRKDIYICNVLKCRPPNNRNPLDDEISNCSPYLEKQISIINPKSILTLGNFASKHILKTDAGISRLRGKTYQVDGRIIVPTYHPSALLQNPQYKRGAWHDLKLLRLIMQKNTQ